jgi:hypothetical protein
MFFEAEFSESVNNINSKNSHPLVPVMDGGGRGGSFGVSKLCMYIAPHTSNAHASSETAMDPETNVWKAVSIDSDIGRLDLSDVLHKALPVLLSPNPYLQRSLENPRFDFILFLYPL